MTSSDVLFALCRERGLSMPPGMSPEQLSCYNGIGPDRWHPWFRSLTTRLLTHYEPPALIHDWEYTYQAKTYIAFTQANMRFAWNAVIDAYYAHHMTLRFAVYDALLGVFLAILCQLGGWRGYKAAMPPATATITTPGSGQKVTSK